MYKLALVGGQTIRMYTVADKLWELLSEASGIGFEFSIIPLASEAELKDFYAAYRNDNNFVGFNVALPWKMNMAQLVGSEGPVNTIYKRQGSILGFNTDPLGIERGFGGMAVLPANPSVLILGAGGGGIATAGHLSQKGAMVHIYDIEHKELSREEARQCESIDQVARQRYDLVINATPLGKYYFDTAINSFTAPIDLEILKTITHGQTIVQEMNYMPKKTLLLQMADMLGLHAVSGVGMLVFQAVESLNRYFDVALAENQVKSVIEAMNAHITSIESGILSLSNKGALIS